MAQIQSVSRDGLVVCACGGKEYNVRDAIDAALFRAELESVWKEFLSSVAAEEQAKKSQLDPDYGAIEEMAELFRYEHDLITAEETEQWLADRGLTLEDFSDYFARRCWRTALERNVLPDDAELVFASAELRELFTIELIFSDELDCLTTELTWRLAAQAANGTADVDPKEISDERQQFLDRNKINGSKLKRWLNRIGRDEQWLEETLAMEVTYRRVCETVLTEQGRQKQLAMLRMPLTRFEAEVIEVESSDAAREALMCIREDGMSMEQVATEARYPYRRTAFRYEDVPNELQQKFWSIGAGALLEPLPRGDGFELYRIIKKSEPELGDTIVQERIDERLLERHFSALVRDFVQMRLPVSSE